MFITPKENSSTIVLPHAGRISAGRIRSPSLWHPMLRPFPGLLSFFAAPSSPSPLLDGIQDRGATDNSTAAHVKVTIIIKTQVGILTRHGKISPQYQGLDKKERGGKRGELMLKSSKI